MSLSKSFNPSENRYEIKIYNSPMDEENASIAEMDIPISREEVVKTKKKKSNHNPKWYRYLLSCLDERRHNHMLKYVPGSNEKEFTVIFIDRKNKGKWRTIDISLFEDLDKYMETIHNKKRSKDKAKEDVKTRFKSNMWKCLKRGYVELIRKVKKEKYKTVKTYKILWRPLPVSVGGSNSSEKNGRNQEKLHKKSHKQTKETDLSRRKFQEKIADPENIPQVGNSQIINNEIISQMGNFQIMKNEIAPQMDNYQILNFESIPQFGYHEVINTESISQMSNHEIMNTNSPQMGHHEMKNFESISKKVNGKNKVVEINKFVESLKISDFAKLPLEGESKMHYESVGQEDNIVSLHVFEEKHEKYSHYLCPSKNSEIRIDENVLVNSGINWENLKILSPVECFSFENDDGIGNQFTWNNGKYIEDGNQKNCECTNLESDPLICSGQFENDFNPLGSFDDWSCSYQPLIGED